MHQHTTQLPPIALNPPEVTAPPSPSRASGSCHRSKNPKCHGYKSAPSCSPGSLAALSQTKVLSGCWLIHSEIAFPAAVKMAMMPASQSSCQILSESFVLAKCVPMFLKENIICISSSWKTLFKKWGLCVYI